MLVEVEQTDTRTGKHVVADLHCAGCNTELGWMYIKAPNGEQRYKEGELLRDKCTGSGTSVKCQPTLS